MLQESRSSLFEGALTHIGLMGTRIIKGTVYLRIILPNNAENKAMIIVKADSNTLKEQLDILEELDEKIDVMFMSLCLI